MSFQGYHGTGRISVTWHIGTLAGGSVFFFSDSVRFIFRPFIWTAFPSFTEGAFPLSSVFLSPYLPKQFSQWEKNKGKTYKSTWGPKPKTLYIFLCYIQSIFFYIEELEKQSNIRWGGILGNNLAPCHFNGPRSISSSLLSSTNSLLSHKMVSELLFYCHDKTLWPRKLIKESITFGVHASGRLKFMTVTVKNMARGRMTW